jgi:uncharacterized protein with PQ loop repeat
MTTILSALGTASGIALVLPQIIKTLKSKSAAGVSLGGLIASFFSWYLWVPYTLSTGDLRGTLGLAIPGAVQGVAVYVAFKYKAERSGLFAPVLMISMVAGAFLLGGWGLYMTALGTTTIWAYAPSIVSAARSKDVSGVSLAAWWVTVFYGASWLLFGLTSNAGGFVYTGTMNAGLSMVVITTIIYRTRIKATAKPVVYSPVPLGSPARASLVSA